MFAPTRRTARILAALLAAAALGATASSAVAVGPGDCEANAEKVARFNVELYTETFDVHE